MRKYKMPLETLEYFPHSLVFLVSLRSLSILRMPSLVFLLLVFAVLASLVAATSRFPSRSAVRNAWGSGEIHLDIANHPSYFYDPFPGSARSRLDAVRAPTTAGPVAGMDTYPYNMPNYSENNPNYRMGSSDVLWIGPGRTTY